MHSFSEYDFTVLTDEVANPVRLIEHLTRMCRELRALIDERRYSWLQVYQAVWGIFGPDKGACGLHLWQAHQVSQALREACIRSMYCVFADVVQHLPEDEDDDTFFMWWEFVSEGFCESHGHWEDEVFLPEDPGARSGQDVILETLQRVLELDDDYCRNAAIHGIGHLHHPRGSAVVQQYIDAHRTTVTEDRLRWLELCRDGQMM